MQSPLLQHTERNVVWLCETWLLIILILCGFFLSNKEHSSSSTSTCLPAFISFNVRGQWNNHDLFKNTILDKNNAISHYMYVVYISNKRVDAQTWRYSWSMSNLNTGMRLRENHVVLLAITMKRMDLNHILQSYITNVIVPISQPEVNVINGIGLLCCILNTRMPIYEHKSRTV